MKSGVRSAFHLIRTTQTLDNGRGSSWDESRKLLMLWSLP